MGEIGLGSLLPIAAASTKVRSGPIAFEQRSVMRYLIATPILRFRLLPQCFHALNANANDPALAGRNAL